MRTAPIQQLVVDSYRRWSRVNAPKLGAAVAYYSLLSLAPLAVLLVAMCGVAFRNEAQQDLLRQATALAGPGAGQVVGSLLENVHHKGTGIVATVIALATLLFGASGVFLELRDSLNLIWEAPPPQHTGWRGIVFQRLTSFAMVLGFGVLMISSLLVSTVLGVVEKYAAGYLSTAAASVSEIANFILSFAIIGVLFAALFRFVPNCPVSWSEAGRGGVFTALLFLIGKSLLAIYLTTAAVGSAYGAAGSVVAFVVWIYYSAQIFFFGACFTRAYAERRRKRAAPLKAMAQGAGL